MISQQPYSLYIPPTSFFLLLCVKSKVVSLSLFQDSFKTSWVGDMQTIAKDEFAIAFWQLYEYFYKCIQIGDDYIEKS
jgi:hypothetical protein